MKHSKWGLIARGAGMGIAEVIPGVSGGTIAFITGIYSTLIDSIKAFDLELITLIRKREFKLAAKKINLPFLIYLLSGMAAGVLFGIFFIAHMLENSPEVLWAGFFALILASVPYMVKSLKEPHWRHVPFFIMALFAAYIITHLTPASASDDYLYIFFGGVVAIVALVLPGISGSFILLLLGLYTLIIPSLKTFLSAPAFNEFKIIFFFALGCIVGLVFFSRIISAAFQLFHDLTVATMTGFMIGSLNKIWPWRNPTTLLNKETGEILDVSSEEINALMRSDLFKVLEETNVGPADYYADPHLVPVLLVFFVSAAAVLALSRYAKRF